jgi:hypothetical protein
MYITVPNSAPRHVDMLGSGAIAHESLTCPIYVHDLPVSLAGRFASWVKPPVRVGCVDPWAGLDTVEKERISALARMEFNLNLSPSSLKPRRY